MPRWEHLCQDCWQEVHPTEYLPEESLDVDECAACGTNALVYGSRPADRAVGQFDMGGEG